MDDLSARAVLDVKVTAALRFDHATERFLTRDRNAMLTANVVARCASGHRPRRSPGDPFLVGGAGIVWMRDEIAAGWSRSSDPAFTVGGGLRARYRDDFPGS